MTRYVIMHSNGVKVHYDVFFMTKKIPSLSRPAADAAAVLGGLIKVARLDKRWSQRDLAERLSVDPRTVAAIEAGLPTVSIGSVFQAAFLTGVPLFGLEGTDLAAARRRGEETLSLLPQRIRTPKQEVDDGLDF